jgi:ATP-dependent DNA ligase
MSPSPTRVKQLAREHPTLFFAFDFLVDDKGKALVDRPLSDRRHRLELFSQRFLVESCQIQLTPVTCDRSMALKWFDLTGESLEGVVAKRLDRPYASGSRSGMVKVKRMRTMDCVVGGFTYSSHDESVGSLLLGLFDEEQNLRYVGGTKLASVEGKSILKKLEALIKPPGFIRRKSGRFISSFPEVWTPVMPVVVVEVRYDRFTGGHFRQGTSSFAGGRTSLPKTVCSVNLFSDRLALTDPQVEP